MLDGNVLPASIPNSGWFRLDLSKLGYKLGIFIIYLCVYRYIYIYMFFSLSGSLSLSLSVSFSLSRLLKIKFLTEKMCV